MFHIIVSWLWHIAILIYCMGSATRQKRMEKKLDFLLNHFDLEIK